MLQVGRFGRAGPSGMARLPTNRASACTASIALECRIDLATVVGVENLDLERPCRLQPLPPPAPSTWCSVTSLGLTRTAMRVAFGISARRRSSRFAMTSPLKILTPVRLPPGLARLAARPRPTGSWATMNRMGIILVAAFAANAAGGPPVAMTATFRCTRSAANPPQPVALVFRKPVKNRYIVIFDEAGFPQSLTKRAQANSQFPDRPDVEETNHRHRPLLRVSRERPYSRSAAKQRDELPPLHSITSSARTRSDSGTESPSAFAVFKLRTVSYFVGASTGRSAGLAPRSTRSTYDAARRN